MRGLVAALAILWSAPALAHLSRPTNREPEPLQYEAGDRVLAFASPGGGIRVHYVVEGRNGVGGEDLDRDAIVDRVERIAELYDAALATFTSTLGFAPPPADDMELPDFGGDDRLDVYLLETEVHPGGRLLGGCFLERPMSCWSYILHPIGTEDDALFAKKALFRTILAGYRAGYDGPLELGSAAWAAEDDSHFESYLSAADRSLGDAAGAEDGGTSLFLAFLSDRFGPGIVRDLWTEIGAPLARPDWKVLLDGILQSHGSSLEMAFADFAVANAELEPRIDELGETAVELAPLSARYFRVPGAGSISAKVIGADALELALIDPSGTVARGTGAAPPVIESEGEAVLVAINGGVEAAGAAALCAGDAEEIRDCGEAGCRCVLDPRAPPEPLLFLLLIAVLAPAYRRRRTSRSAAMKPNMPSPSDPR